MAKAMKLKSDGRTITVRVPILIRKRGGRKVVLAPDGSRRDPSKPRCQVDNALAKAMARAFRWQELLEDGTCANIKEIGEREQINLSYVSRVMRLTLLAPNIVEGIIDGSHGSHITLAMLMGRIPVLWRDQQAAMRR